jgi:hypothetical protein
MLLHVYASQSGKNSNDMTANGAVVETHNCVSRRAFRICQGRFACGRRNYASLRWKYKYEIDNQKLKTTSLYRPKQLRIRHN